MTSISEYREDMCATLYRQGFKLHRTNGPAIMWDSGMFCWWLNDGLHRYYGPSNIVNDWHLNGQRVK